MIHSQSKSSKIKSEGISDEKSSSNKKTNVVNGNNSTSDSAHYMSSTKKELNLESYFDNNNIEKMSNLFCNDENDDKIINISKLDEDLYSNDKKSERIEKNKHLTRDSNSQLIEVNKNSLDNNSKIINISNLEFQVNFPNKAQAKNENTNSNENAISDINANLNENANNQIHKTEEIKINEIKETKKDADEAFKVKKKSFFDKISFRFKIIILIISLLLALLVLTFFILKISIG